MRCAFVKFKRQLWESILTVHIYFGGRVSLVSAAVLHIPGMIAGALLGDSLVFTTHLSVRVLGFQVHVTTCDFL